MWDNCSVECGGGNQSRYRDCIGPFYGGANCTGLPVDTQDCNTHFCPSKFYWTLFDWINRPVWVKGLNVNLIHEYIQLTGFLFISNLSKTFDMILVTCVCIISVDGNFTVWSDWYMCDLTCGGGIQWRNRSCDGPYYGGLPCNGSYNDSQDCNTHECPSMFSFSALLYVYMAILQEHM